jgi:hypothetical protein
MRSSFNLKTILFAGIFTVLTAFTSCRSDKPEVIDQAPIVAGSKSVYITNEGNFQFGNASVSYYSPDQNQVVEDIFKANNNQNLGDVCQSIAYFNEKFYLVVNNSHKIEVVTAGTFKSCGTISGLNSPRYFLPVNNQKGYVTDIYDNNIAIVDLNSNSVTGHIPCTGWTEELTMISGKVFVSNPYRNKIYVINSITDQITDSISIGYASNSLKEDKYGKLWVLCGGNSTTSLAGGLYCINPATNVVEQSFPFASATGNPCRLRINATNDTLFWLNNGIYRMSITATVIPTTPFIAQSGVLFYGLGIDPTTNEIYVSDAIDYVQKGVIYRYQSNGTLINTFRAGITPGDFYFK